MKSAVVKRSIVVGGHKTSVSLEDAFWSGLRRSHQIASSPCPNWSAPSILNVSTAIYHQVFGFSCSITIAARLPQRRARQGSNVEIAAPAGALHPRRIPQSLCAVPAEAGFSASPSCNPPSVPCVSERWRKADWLDQVRSKVNSELHTSIHKRRRLSRTMRRSGSATRSIARSHSAALPHGSRPLSLHPPFVVTWPSFTLTRLLGVAEAPRVHRLYAPGMFFVNEVLPRSPPLAAKPGPIPRAARTSPFCDCSIGP